MGTTQDWMSEKQGLALGSRLRRFSDYLSAEIKTVYKVKGIDFNPRHFPVVSLVCSKSSHYMSIRELSEETGLTHSSISQTVTKLEMQGLVTRQTSSEDERLVTVIPTAKALSFVELQLDPIWQVIKEVTDENLPTATTGFWDSLKKAEELMHGEPLSRKILKRL